MTWFCPIVHSACEAVPAVSFSRVSRARVIYHATLGAWMASRLNPAGGGLQGQQRSLPGSLQVAFPSAIHSLSLLARPD